MNKPTVTLRALEPEDLDELYAIENDRSIWNVGHTNVPYSRYALHDYIAHQQADIFADRQVRLIIENDRHETIGVVDLVNYAPQHSRAELGIVVKQAYRQQGYGHAAVEAILEYARKTLHLHQVYAIVGADNHGAITLFRQVGFTEGVVLPDWICEGEKYCDALLMQTFL